MIVYLLLLPALHAAMFINFLEIHKVDATIHREKGGAAYVIII